MQARRGEGVKFVQEFCAATGQILPAPGGNDLAGFYALAVSYITAEVLCDMRPPWINDLLKTPSTLISSAQNIRAYLGQTFLMWPEDRRMVFGNALIDISLVKLNGTSGGLEELWLAPSIPAHTMHSSI